MKFSFFLGGVTALASVVRGLGQQLSSNDANDPRMQRLKLLCEDFENSISCFDVALLALDKLNVDSIHFGIDYQDRVTRLKQPIDHLEKYLKGDGNTRPCQKAKNYVHLALAKLYYLQHDSHRSLYHLFQVYRKDKEREFARWIAVTNENDELDIRLKEPCYVMTFLNAANVAQFNNVENPERNLGIRRKTEGGKKVTKNAALKDKDPEALLKHAADKIDKQGNTQTSDRYIKQAIKADPSLEDIANQIQAGSLSDPNDIDNAVAERRRLGLG